MAILNVEIYAILAQGLAETSAVDVNSRLQNLDELGKVIEKDNTLNSEEKLALTGTIENYRLYLNPNKKLV